MSDWIDLFHDLMEDPAVAVVTVLCALAVLMGAALILGGGGRRDDSE